MSYSDTTLIYYHNCHQDSRSVKNVNYVVRNADYSVKEIQEVNGKRREAVAQGLTIQEAMEKYPSR